jgi:hypothetical protein
MESLMHNLFSCGCVSPGLAVSTGRRKSVFASKPLGGENDSTNESHTSRMAPTGGSSSSTASGDGSSYVSTGATEVNSYSTSNSTTTMNITLSALEPPEIQRLTLKDANHLDIIFMTH